MLGVGHQYNRGFDELFVKYMKSNILKYTIQGNFLLKI